MHIPALLRSHYCCNEDDVLTLARFPDIWPLVTTRRYFTLCRCCAGKYTYTSLASLRPPIAKAHVYGVVSAFSHRRQSRGSDATTSVSLLDETCTQPDNAVPCNFFHFSRGRLPAPLMVGDIVRIHRAKASNVLQYTTTYKYRFT